MQLAGTSKTYCLQIPALVSAKDVASAQFDPHAYDKSTIQLTLKDDAARRFKEVTGRSIGVQVGVVLNGRLVSVATIAAPTGNVWIAGLPHDTAELVIRAFPPPAPR